MFQRSRRVKFTNGFPALLSLGRSNRLSDLSNSRKCSLERAADAISARSLTAALGQVTR
jgi:hypothetical protein